MRAAWYEKNGPAADVMQVGDCPTRCGRGRGAGAPVRLCGQSVGCQGARRQPQDLVDRIIPTATARV